MKKFILPENELFLTIKDISVYLSIKQKTIYAKVEAGEIPHYRIGHLIRFRLNEIDAWLEGCSNKGSQIPLTTKKRRKSNKGAVDHFSKIITKTIDEEADKYYSTNHGKSDRIKGPRKEINHGSI